MASGRPATSAKATQSGFRIRHTMVIRLARLAATLAADVRKYGQRNPAKVQKDDKGDKREQKRDLLEIVEADLASGWELIAQEVNGDLGEVSGEGAREALAQLEITDSGMISGANAVAREWAHNRAAEMVGMKWDGDKLVPNPNADWTISETTRDAVRQLVTESFESQSTIDELAQSILDSASFSEARAEMIARTEVARAEIEGNKSGWEKSGIVKSVRVLLSMDHDPAQSCDCEEVALDGPYEIDDSPMLPRHPYCMCVLVVDKLTGED